VVGMAFRPWLHRHCGVLDVATAVSFVILDTVVTMSGASWWPAHPDSLAWTMLVLQAVACSSLYFRQRAPLVVVAVLGVFTLVVTLLVAPFDAIHPAHANTVWAPFATSLAAYGPFFRHQTRRREYVALALLTIVAARPWEPSLTVIAVALLRIAVGPVLALYFDARRRLVLALTERAERAERERHLLADQARAEERTRLAGEMHDVVTHRVSLMVLQAGALRMTAKDEATRQAAEELRAAGCQALDELRDLVGILRTAPPGDEPMPDQTPSVSGIVELVAESTAVGTPAELIEEGDRSLASPVVGRTAYRTVREALTNVRKHAPGAQVTVRITYEEAQIRLVIHNAPPSERLGNGAVVGGSELAGTGSGLGIANLRQRIELVHGTLRAGSAPDGGFCVEATLPAYVPTAESVV
jgi:signal transduction histidine kinase